MSPHRLVVAPGIQGRHVRNKHHRIYGSEHLATQDRRDNLFLEQIVKAWTLLDAIGLPALFLLLLSISIAFTAGGAVISRLWLGSNTDRVEKGLFSVGVGLGILSYLTFLFGALQLYYPWIFRLGILAISIVLFPCWKQAWENFKPMLRCQWFSTAATKPGDRLVMSLTAVLCALYGGIYLLVALGPETEFDALNYHLGVPRLYIAWHGIEAVPNIFYSNFPFTVEMLFTFGWLLHSVILAKLFHFALGMTCAAAIVLFCRRYFSLRIGLLAALLFLASPIVGYLFQTAYVDLGLALFVFLSLYAFYNWTESGHRGWLILTAVFSGLSLGTKYTGLLAVVLVSGGCLWLRSRASRSPISVRALLTYLAITALVFVPWSIKNAVLVGNPVAPFLSDVFYNPAFLPSDYEAWLRFVNDWGGYGGTLWDYLRSPWLLTWHEEVFMGTPGPAYLIFLPLAVLLGWRNRTLAFLMFCTVLGYAFQIMGTRQVRFFVPLFPLISVVIAGGLLSWTPHFRWKGTRIVRQGFLLLLLLLMVVQLPHFSHLWQDTGILMLKPDSATLFTSHEKRTAYLEKTLLGASALEFYDFLEENIPAGESILSVTEAYQSLTSHPLYMPPNCSPASELSRKVIQSSLAEAKLATVQLVLSPAQGSRYWKVRVSADNFSPASRPRVYRRKEGHHLELPVFGVKYSQQESRHEWVLDLGSSRRVDRIDYLSPVNTVKVAGQTILMALSGREWKSVPFDVRTDIPRILGSEDLAKAFRQHRVHYVFYCAIPEVGFLHDFFRSPETKRHFRLVRKVGDYFLYVIAPSVS